MEPSREACSIRHGEPVALGVPRILAVRLEASALAPSRQTQRRGLGQQLTRRGHAGSTMRELSSGRFQTRRDASPE